MADPIQQNKEQAVQPTRLWWLVSGFWVVVMIAMGVQEWLSHRAEPLPSFIFAATLWLPWALLTPVIAWLCGPFTLERGRWQRAFVVHLAVCAVITVILGTISYWFPPPSSRPANASSTETRRVWSLGDTIIRRGTFQLPLYWAIVGIAHAFIFYERSRDRERHAALLESRLTKSRLQALQMQLNPHFLFNTLNSIASLVHENPKVADEMIGRLSEFLRMTLKVSDRSEVTMREELEFLEHYLAIEQLRFGERLRVEMDIAPETLDARVPVLILQPLVENAIKHGVEAQVAAGVLKLSARKHDDTLHLQVADNGKGLNETVKHKEGIGLANTRARLHEIAGTAASLELKTPPGGGFIADIQLPWRNTPSAA